MDQLIEIAPGVSRQELHEGRIVILQIATVAREAVDAAYETVLEVHQRCEEKGQLFLFAYEVSSPQMFMTPYIRSMVNKLNVVNPQIHGRVAVILPQSSMGVLLQIFVSVLRSSNRPKRVFFSRDEAIQWLEELL
jgi:hypothetical protein